MRAYVMVMALGMRGENGNEELSDSHQRVGAAGW